jgi:signal transduction histidine kinase
MPLGKFGDSLTNMRLRTRYALVLLFILLILGTIVVGTTQLFQQQVVDQEREDLDQTSQLAAEQIEEGVRESQIFLGFHSTRFRNDLSESERILNQVTEDESEFRLGVVVNSTGHIIDIRGDIAGEIEGVSEEQWRQSQIGRNVSDQEYVAEPLFENRSHIEEPAVEDWGQISVTMSQPIVINSSVQGVLAAAVFFGEEQEGLTRYFGALQPLNTDSQSAFVEYEGENETIPVHTAGDRFVDSISSESTVNQTGWTVEVQRDRSALTNRLQLLQFVQFGSLFVVLLSVFGLGYFEYRTNLRQTKRLLGGFDELAQGNFDYEPGLTGAREWEQIGGGFKAMASGLHEREEAIRERERQIKERERRLSVLNRVLRHNLQNDMTVIQGQAEIIPITDSQEQREKASEKIIEMSRGLVDHGKKARRLETVMENAQDEPVEIDMVDKVEDMVDDYAADYGDVSVETDFPPHGYVSAVSGVEFGIESLIENAFEHNDAEAPEVHVSITRDDDQTHIKIKDNGSGIPDHEIDVLRQDEETSLEHGSGIGLWLAYWAVEKSNGELEFKEPADGGGYVIVSLPNAEPPEALLDTIEGEESEDEETDAIDDLLDLPE